MKRSSSEISSKGSLEVIRQKLIARCFSLASEIHSSGDYVDQLNEYNAEFSNKIFVNYPRNEYTKQGLLTLCIQEFAKQALYLEVERFKISIKNYFYSESEDTHTLYADLISIYQKIDKDDSNIPRINKSVYKKFLHESATEQNLYIDTIKQSLDSIYFISQERINQYLAKLNAADITELNIMIDLIDLDTMYLALFSGVSGVFTILGAGLVATATTAATTATVAVATVAKVSAAMIAGGVFLVVGVIGAATTVGVMASWTRGTAWRGMATYVRKSIIDHHSFKSNYQNLIDMLEIINHPSS